MLKRSFTALLVYFCLTVSVLAQDAGREAFMRLRSSERETIQSYLSGAGLYHSSVDGLWGQGTSDALAAAAAQLAETGVFYEVRKAESAEALYRFLLVEAGKESVFSEGSECDGCNPALNDVPAPSDETASNVEAGSVAGKTPGVFEAVLPNSFTGVQVSADTSSDGARNYCVAKLGSFTDGNDILEAMAYRRYDMWGFVFVSDRSITPPMFLPDLFKTDGLLMAVTSQQRGNKWVSEFVNTNTNYMDDIDQQTSIKLSVGRGGSYILLQIPFLPQVISELRNCTQADDARNWQKFCLEKIPPEYRILGQHPECAPYWR